MYALLLSTKIKEIRTNQPTFFSKLRLCPITRFFSDICPMSESKRQLKFGKLIQKELGEIFQKDTKGKFGKAFITVMAARMSPDLGVAKVWLSVMMVDDKPTFMKHLDSIKWEIRKMLGQRIGKQVRIIPELVFVLDEGAEYASYMDKVISALDIPPAPPEEDEEKD